MKLDYICGENRNVTISVNGKKVKTFSYCNSGGWDKVATKTLEITLRLEYQVPASIEGVKVSKRQGKVYNLQGVEMNNTESLPRGIYIIDGQKRRVI